MNLKRTSLLLSITFLSILLGTADAQKINPLCSPSQSKKANKLMDEANEAKDRKSVV